jgi:hypothetical protein
MRSFYVRALFLRLPQRKDIMYVVERTLLNSPPPALLSRAGCGGVEDERQAKMSRQRRPLLKMRSGRERLSACDALCHHQAYGTVTYRVNSRRRNATSSPLRTIGTCFSSSNLVERGDGGLGFIAFKRL